MTIPLKPTPWQRSRHAGKRHFLSTKHRAFLYDLQTFFRLRQKTPFAFPVALELIFYLNRSRSPRAHLALVPAKKPDLDNLVKMVLDAGNETLWKDDEQIISLRASKIYGPEEQIELKVARYE